MSAWRQRPGLFAGEHTHTIVGYSLIKGIGDGEPIASERFTVGGHEWVSAVVSQQAGETRVGLEIDSRDLCSSTHGYWYAPARSMLQQQRCPCIRGSILGRAPVQAALGYVSFHSSFTSCSQMPPRLYRPTWIRYVYLHATLAVQAVNMLCKHRQTRRVFVPLVCFVLLPQFLAVLIQSIYSYSMHAF